jgi:hypothetical protein
MNPTNAEMNLGAPAPMVTPVMCHFFSMHCCDHGYRTNKIKLKYAWDKSGFPNERKQTLFRNKKH